MSAQHGNPPREIEIEEVSVTGRRQLQEIGTQKSVLDTFALRQNITYSLAEVLTQSSSIFIKSYGRGTLSTASFRGTAPSHTSVSWNGMKLNSPMLGMVDFSLIPSYFIDKASLYHGASSVGVSGGGLGGAVELATKPSSEEGLQFRFIQGFGSFKTFDEFLQMNYGTDKLQLATRVFYTSSDNDFKYTNYRKKEFIYDEYMNIVGWEYPEERNKNGSFLDFHIMQEAYYRMGKGNSLGFSAWYMNSRRGVPLLSVDYKEENAAKTRQNDETFRTGVNWSKISTDLKLNADAGYTYTDLLYVYNADLGDGTLREMIHSQSYVHTVYGRLGAEYSPHSKWMISGNISINQHLVKSMDYAVVNLSGVSSVIGYDKGRAEASGFLAVRYRPTERLGFAANIREEFYGDTFTPIIPALFAEYVLSKKGEVTLKASVARNYRYPTLNDLYFMPGGNDTLKSEKGFTYDAGIAFAVDKNASRLAGELTFYDSHISDWIAWLPTFKGFWSPVNVKKVRSYGLEAKASFFIGWAGDWKLRADGNFTLTNARNQGDPASWADQSIGKQLVYIPKYSSALSADLRWRTWAANYRWTYYSKRYTTSSNETATKLGTLGNYFMNDLSLEKSFTLPFAAFSLKATVHNIFNEEYESVLSRPMAGRNYGFYIEIRPNIGKHKRK